MYEYFVYILRSKSRGTLYIGVTNDLSRRIEEHRNKVFSSFTQKYAVNQLVYFESFQYVYDALQREKQLKKWNRVWKIALIEKANTSIRIRLKYTRLFGACGSPLSRG